MKIMKLIKTKLTLSLLLITAIGFSQTKDSVYNYLIEIGVKHPKIVLKQCLYESAHLKSNICKSNNNLFGMKFPRQRKTTATKVKNKHAYYNNWKDSVKDYKIWQNKYYKGGCYYDFILTSGYCPHNDNYIKTLKQIRLSLTCRFNAEKYKKKVKYGKLL